MSKGRRNRRTNPRRRQGDDPLKLWTDKERQARQQLETGKTRELAALVKDSLLVLIFPVMMVARMQTQSARLRALSVLANNSVKAARCAYSGLAAGYAFAAIPNLRAMLERVSMMLSVRKDEPLAARLLDRTASMGDVDRGRKHDSQALPQLLLEFWDKAGLPGTPGDVPGAGKLG